MDVAGMLPAIDAQVHEMRRRDEQAPAGHQHAVHEQRMRMQERDAQHQQKQTGNGEQQGQPPAMSPVSGNQRDAGEHRRESDETGLEAVVGQERQAEQRQQRDDERQRGAMNGAKERGGGAEAVGGMPPTARRFLLCGRIGHGSHSVTCCTGRGK